MPDADEFSGPVDYSSQWLWFAIGALALVALFYLGVLLWSHAGGPKPLKPGDVPTARTRAMGELDRIGHQVYAGQLAERVGYQQLSSVIRDFVSAVSGMPAHTMALADLRAAGVPHLAETIALIYPPEFAPDSTAVEPFGTTLNRARGLVSSWN
ncbi:MULTISPECIES: hypothetical protein [unclassified Nocardioides]|uniref:hypothetical protein n=1 Tax=unclassified Nocardioides TaxID=2615069 RepID=UPI0006FDCD37|nr:MULTISPECIES: hypothetical protein [unclassified Nocardioides]KQY63840.1 hypothetical protein ASD30_02325 [Nocardioides sp. Root140]KQZ69759.1 hypothetical protein ASD66_08570 [Nocardioides sp. Root151]KRF15853.1 hypothetical protein ASH02_04320 [Nocardioides sp. Soil796]